MKCPKCKYVSHDYLESCRKCGADLVAFKRDIGLVVRQPGVLDLSFVLSEAGADDLFASVEEEVPLHAGNDDDFALSLDDDADHPQAWRASDRVPRTEVRETAEALTGPEPPALELETASQPAELVARPPAAPALPTHVPETIATPVEKSEIAEGAAAQHTEGSNDGARGAEGHTAPPEVVDPVDTTLSIFELSADDLLLASQADALSGSDIPTVVEPARDVVDASSPQEASLWPVVEFTPESSASVVEPRLSDPAVPGRDDPALGDVQASALPGDLSIDLSPPEVGPEEGWTTPDALALEELDVLLLPEYLTLDLDATESMPGWASTTLDEVQLDDPSGDVQSHMSPPQNQAGDDEELLLDLDEGVFDDDAPA